MKKQNGILVPLSLLIFFLATGFDCVAQTEGRRAAQTASCRVQADELEIFAAYLNQGRTSPQVVVTQTEPVRPDLDSLNLRLAAQGRGIPPDLRADFMVKNKSACTMKPFDGSSNLYFISREDHDSIFREGWSDFHRKYGKDAEILRLSRVGFNSDKTLALLHVSGGIDRMAGGGTLFLFQRKDGKWVLKSQVQTWAT